MVCPFALVAGAILFADAALTGVAQLYLPQILPVFTGSTTLFGLGAVLLLVGIVFLPLTFAGDEGSESEPTGTPRADTLHPDTGSGGGVFIGPVPIFFGRWREHPPIAYRWALLLGVALVFVVAVVLLWGFAAF